MTTMDWISKRSIRYPGPTCSPSEKPCLATKKRSDGNRPRCELTDSSLQATEIMDAELETRTRKETKCVHFPTFQVENFKSRLTTWSRSWQTLTLNVALPACLRHIFVLHSLNIICSSAQLHVRCFN